MTFQQEARMTAWRDLTGVGAFNETNGTASPDLRYWDRSTGADTPSNGSL
jgi:hypothetical protein